MTGRWWELRPGAWWTVPADLPLDDPVTFRARWNGPGPVGLEVTPAGGVLGLWACLELTPPGVVLLEIDLRPDGPPAALATELPDGPEYELAGQRYPYEVDNVRTFGHAEPLHRYVRPEWPLTSIYYPVPGGDGVTTPAGG